MISFRKSPLIAVLILVTFIISVSCGVRNDFFSISQGGGKDSSGATLALDDAQATSCTTVRLMFSSSVEMVSAETRLNYLIPGLSIVSAARDAVDFSVVWLTTSLQADSEYTISVSGVRDLDNNPLGTGNSLVFNGDAAPRLSGAGSSDNTGVSVLFSEPVELSSAQNAAHYSIPGLSVLSAARDSADFSRVTLLTDSQTSGTYTLTVSGVRDLTANLIAAPFSMSFTGTAPVDTTPPALIGASLAGAAAFNVYFSESMDPPSSQTPLSYDVRDGGGAALSVISAVLQADPKVVQIRVASFLSKHTYTLTVSTSVRDENLNPLSGPPSNSVSFAGQGARILQVQAVSATAVRVDFSHEVELAPSENLSNYSIPGLTVSGATRDAADFRIVTLATSPHQNINYTLTAQGFIDPDSAVFIGDIQPCLMSVSSFGTTLVLVCFSEPVDPASAQNSSNYSVTPALSVYSAVQDSYDPAHVTLTTGTQTTSSYTLTVSSVKDLNGNPLTDPVSMNFTGTSASDTTRPSVLSARLIDADTFEIWFSEPMDQASSETEVYYTVTDSYSTSVPVAYASRQSDPSRVRIDAGVPLDGCLYTVEVSVSVKDVKLNQLMAFPSNTASFTGSGHLPESLADGPVLANPFNSSTDDGFSLLALYRGWIYLGPSNADNAVLRMRPDGSAAELVNFLFRKGSTVTPSLDPGPDGEEGIDFFASGTLKGTEYLVFGPAKSSGLKYIYFTSEYGKTLNFTAMDLSMELGGNTEGVSAMTVFNGRLYIGFPDDGGNSPYFHKIVNLVESPVMDVDFYNLDGDDLPRIGVNASIYKNQAGKVGIDSFGVWGGRFFLANGGKAAQNQDGGIVQSANADPWPAHLNPGDWQDATPTSHPEWYDPAGRYNVELSKLNRLTPAEKAFPAMAEFNGRLYAIRNTAGSAGGPQLWRYDGSSWTLVGDNGSGITNMGDTANARATLLVANGDRLYLGFDNAAGGAQVWRTATGVTDPLSALDFEPVSTSGFGFPSKNQTSTAPSPLPKAGSTTSGSSRANRGKGSGSTEREIDVPRPLTCRVRYPVCPANAAHVRTRHPFGVHGSFSPKSACALPGALKKTALTERAAFMRR